MYFDLENFASHRYVFWYTNKPQVLAGRIKLATCDYKQQ
jgi:hypothetical protein